jgi:hypothetical protein
VKDQPGCRISPFVYNAPCHCRAPDLRQHRMETAEGAG